MKVLFRILIIAILAVGSVATVAQTRTQTARKSSVNKTQRAGSARLLAEADATALLNSILVKGEYGWEQRDRSSLESKLVANGYKEIQNSNATLYTSDGTPVKAKKKIFEKDGIKVEETYSIEKGYVMEETAIVFASIEQKNTFFKACMKKGAEKSSGGLYLDAMKIYGKNLKVKIAYAS